MKKNTFIIYYIFSLLIFCWACQENQKSEKINTTITYGVDTLNIPIDSTSQNFYFIFNHFKRNNSEYLVYFNSYRHSLDIINLDSQKVSNIIFLEKEGNNGIMNPTSVHFQNQDSIFIYSNYNQTLALLNLNGKVYQTYHLGSHKAKNDIGDLLADHNFPMQYDNKSGNMYFYHVHSGDIPKSISSSIVATFNIHNNQISLLPIKYSANYINEKGQFGNFWNANLSIADNKLIYNFQAESGIYTADLEGNKQNNHEAKSKFTKNQVSAYNPNEDGEKHGIENPAFFRVLHDPYRHLYYRFHWGDIPHKNDKGKLNTFLDKPLFLTVFDEKFNVLEEIKMPEQTYAVYTWFVNSKGLCINSGNAILKNANQEEGKMEIHVYQFETKNSL